MPVSPSSADTNEQNLSLSRNHEFGLDNSYGTCLSSHFTSMDTGVVILCSFPFLMFPWSF
jgi:hypothetical protein